MHPGFFLIVIGRDFESERAEAQRRQMRQPDAEPLPPIEPAARSDVSWSALRPRRQARETAPG
jgi:hypothetical protein